MRNYAGSALMLVLTTAVIVGSYTVNLKVSAERAQVEKLRRQLVADARNLRDLQAELRTRARLPQMQRWNDDVLLMSAPVAGQYLRNPVQLAGFGVPEAEATPAAPAVTHAVTRSVTTPAPAPVVRASYSATPVAPQPETARVVSAAWRSAPARPVAPPVLTIESAPLVPAMAVPQDLLLDGQQ